MSTLIKKIMDAQQYAITIRPKVGGFPVLAEVFRQAGIQMNRWSLPSCQSFYFMEEGVVVQLGTPLVTGMHDVPKFDQEALVRAIRKDQEGYSTFPEFLQETWNAGVIGYDANFMERKVTYFGARGERYEEDYPAVEVNR